jgi:hypothetical protein
MFDLVKRREEAVFDILNLIAAIGLFIAPFAFGFAGASAAAWNAWLAAIVIGALAVSAIVAYAQWEEWVNLVAGVWVLVAPWLLGFAANLHAMWTHVLVGILVIVFSGLELWQFSHRQPHATT